MQPVRQWLVIAALLGGIAVACGAFGAHGLESWAETNWPDATRAKRLENWQTAAEYQMYHALALVGVSLVATSNRRLGGLAGTAFTAGTLIFSGCLYAYALTGQTWWGAIVPLGGSLLLVGWGCLAAAAWRRTPS